MLLLLQNVLYCLLYASLIKCAVRNDGRNCLYFYPKEYIEEAQKRGIADKETVMKRSKWFMIPFCIIIFVALILIISVWNHVMDFKTAYLAGYMADKYDVDAQASIENANKRIKRSTEETFRETVQGFGMVTTESTYIDLQNGTAKYALYPVWLLNTQ